VCLEHVQGLYTGTVVMRLASAGCEDAGDDTRTLLLRVTVAEQKGAHET
jgi:hypothetical protein